jgi:hypothetical protein
VVGIEGTVGQGLASEQQNEFWSFSMAKTESDKFIKALGKLLHRCQNLAVPEEMSPKAAVEALELIKATLASISVTVAELERIARPGAL